MEPYRGLLILIGLLFVGLSCLQVYWLREAYLQQDREFRLRIPGLLEEVGAHIRLDRRWDAAIADSMPAATVADSLTLGLHQFIDSMFDANGVEDRFVFALQDGLTGPIALSNSREDSLALSKSPYRMCLSCMIRISFVEESAIETMDEFVL
ncbi:MAG: hypothetical protein AAF206_11895, partial [Bacteroidota bacterium]